MMQVKFNPHYYEDERTQVLGRSAGAYLVYDGESYVGSCSTSDMTRLMWARYTREKEMFEAEFPTE